MWCMYKDILMCVAHGNTLLFYRKGVCYISFVWLKLTPYIFTLHAMAVTSTYARRYVYMYCNSIKHSFIKVGLCLV